jgi:hypothetical protein
VLNKYFWITLVISILFGILLPLSLGVKDTTLIAISFCSVWFFYMASLVIHTFLVKPGLKIKVIRHKNPTIVRYELKDSGRKQWR